MSLVTFQRIALAGFGPYRDWVEFELQEGMNNFVAENERGKSSFVLGLLATIFGLPTSNDPSKFGSARFRNWESSGRFEGEVEFKVNGTLYKIHRQFETNEINLYRMERTGWHQLVTGTHNPLSYKPNERYEEQLRQLFHINARDIFTATFCVTQPMPEAREIDDKVQSLIAGGEIHFASILEILTDELKELTRTTGDRGITPQNLRKDRELEEIDTKIKDLQRRIETSREAVDSLERIQNEITGVSKELAVVKGELQTKVRTRTAWAQWRQLRTDYDKALKEQKKVSKALKEAERLEKELADLQQKIQDGYPEFATVTEDIENKLDDLVSLRKEKKTLEETVIHIRHDREEAHRIKAEATQTLADLPEWDLLGPLPKTELERLQASQKDLIRGWERFQGWQEERERIVDELNCTYQLFQEAIPQEHEILKNYKHWLSSLQEELRQAKEELSSMQAKIADYGARKKEFAEEYIDLEDLGPEALEKVEEQLDQRKKENDLQQQLADCWRRLTPSPTVTLLVAVLVATLGGAVGYLAGLEDNIPLLVFIVVAGGILGYLVTPSIYRLFKGHVLKEAEVRSKELADCQAQIKKNVHQLGPFGFSDEATLGALKQRLIVRNKEEQRLAEIKDSLPGKERLTAARHKVEKAKEELDNFTEKTVKFTETYDDIEHAYTTWGDLCRKRDDLTAKIEEYAQENFNCAARSILTRDLQSETIKEDWARMHSLTQVTVPLDEVKTLGALVKFITDINNEKWWDDAIASATKYEELTAAQKEAAATLSGKDQDLNAMEKRLNTIVKEEQALIEPLAEILAKNNDNAEETRKRWNSYMDLKDRCERLETGLNTLFAQHDTGNLDNLTECKQDADNRTAIALKDWQNFVGEHRGMPEARLDLPPEEIEKTLKELDSTITELEERLADLEERERNLYQRQGWLQGQDPLNIAATELEIKALAEQKAAIELRADALAKAYKELAGAINDFQQTYRQHLEDLATKYFQSITTSDQRVVKIRDDFSLDLWQDGKPCDIEQLSKGAQDQLYLALRFAIADILATEVRLPFIFDDPFLTCDDLRLVNLKDIIAAVACERQMIILSHLEEYADWGTPIRVTKKSPMA